MKAAFKAKDTKEIRAAMKEVFKSADIKDIPSLTKLMKKQIKDLKEEFEDQYLAPDELKIKNILK